MPQGLPQPPWDRPGLGTCEVSSLSYLLRHLQDMTPTHSSIHPSHRARLLLIHSFIPHMDRTPLTHLFIHHTGHKLHSLTHSSVTWTLPHSFIHHTGHDPHSLTHSSVTWDMTPTHSFIHHTVSDPHSLIHSPVTQGTMPTHSLIHSSHRI